MVDRGVVAYASAKTDAERAKGASQIQIAALAGFPSARVLLARNYPQSEAIRSVVPANDVIGYALALLMDPTSEGDDTKQIFSRSGSISLCHGQLDLFATRNSQFAARETRVRSKVTGSISCSICCPAYQDPVPRSLD